MVQAELLAKLKAGVVAWNRWRSDTNVSPIDVSTTDLSRTDLSGFNLRNAILRSANLSQAILDEIAYTYTLRTEFRASDLRGSDLTDADLSGTFIRGVSLEHSKLIRADLTGATIIRADLNGTDFQDAIAGWGSFDNLDLRGALHLDTLRHHGPSSIGVDTIVKSHGDIPEQFLRGCGLSESFVTYGKTVLKAAVEFYSCFISYASKDQALAERLHADLQRRNVRCWFAPHDLKAGCKLHDQIDAAIRLYDKLLLVLSPASMSSKWVATEISKARARETREERRVLFPIGLVPFEKIRAWECFDADLGKDSAREIREYFIPDFSDWFDKNRYQNAFDRLVRDLQTPG